MQEKESLKNNSDSNQIFIIGSPGNKMENK